MHVDCHPMLTYAASMNLITPADAPVFDVPDTDVIAYAAPSRGSTELCLWRIVMAPGSITPPHMECKEVFPCLDGRAVVVTAGEEGLLQADDCLVLAPGTDFSFRVVGDEPFRA